MVKDKLLADPPPPYRLSAKEALLIQAQRLRAEANRIEHLARSLSQLDTEADEALWLLVHNCKLYLRN